MRLPDLAPCGRMWVEKGGEIVDYYQTAQICLNGHCITSTYEAAPLDRQPFCDQCGAKTITECPSCHAKIRGSYVPGGDPMFFGGLGYIVPAFCGQCGAPFPWTQTAIDVTAALINEENELSSDDREALVEVLPAVISETPKTRLAAVRFKKALSAVGEFTSDGLRQFAIDFGCELFKKLLFGA